MNQLHQASRPLLLAAIIAAATAAVFYSDGLDAEALDAWLSGLGVWAPVAFVLFYASGTVIFLPGSIFALVGGALFGPVWGTALNLLAATAGASAAFLVARHVAQDWAMRKAGGRLKRLIEGIDAEGWRFVAFVRLMPLFPFNLTNYALGVTRIGLVPYAVTSLVCMLPGALAYTWLGHAGREALEGDLSAIRYGLVGLGVLAAIVFLPKLVGRLRSAPSDPDGTGVRTF